ncbi:MAG: c-type cytochrome [Verrucomicrobiaceae bacterium]|nr:c-type cytochrome [Verrucomicrobiaceae bacterium]
MALVQELAALFGDTTALDQVRAILTRADLPTGERQAALSLLIQAGDAGTAPLLQGMLSDATTPGGLRRQALQALASLKDPETPKVLAGLLPKLSANELPDAVNTLASTQEGGKALLKAVEDKTVPATALSPFLVRQLAAFNDEELNAQIKAVWGDVNAPKADLAKQTQKYVEMLTPSALKLGDAAKGKLLFLATCGQCHKLFGEGQNVGPDITGSNRADLNYLLENVLDPNAVIGKDYQLNVFTMKDGRVLSGVIKAENPSAVKIAMMGGIEFSLPIADIEKREVSKLSTMPEGLFDALQPTQVIDLVKYLQSGGGSRPAEQAADKVVGAIEGESLTAKAAKGNVRTQGMTRFSSGKWSGGAHLWWTDAKPGDKLTLNFNAAKAGRQKVSAVFTKAPDYGIITITLDGKPTSIREYDLYDPQVIPSGAETLGEFDLAAGAHTLEVTITGSNANAKPRHMFALDYLKLEPQ